MEEKELPFFTVTDGRDAIDENQTEGSVDKAQELLTALFEDIEDSVVTIRLCNKTKKERAKGGKDFTYFEYKVRLKAKEQSAGGINGTILSYIEKNNQLQRELDKKEDERKYQELMRQMDEIKKKRKDDSSPLEKAALQALGQIMSGNKPQGVAIAGADDAPIETDKVKIQQRIKEALKRLMAIDEDLPGSLELLADYVEANPEKLPMIKAMLKT